MQLVRLHKLTRTRFQVSEAASCIYYTSIRASASNQMQLVQLHRLLGNQAPSQWSSFMHILQPSTMFRRQVSKQVQQLQAQEYINQQKLPVILLSTSYRTRGSKQVQVQMQWIRLHNLSESSFQVMKQVQEYTSQQWSQPVTIFWPKAKLYRFHAVESVTVLDLDQRLIKFYQVDFST